MSEGESGAGLRLCPACRGRYHHREAQLLETGDVVQIEVACATCDEGVLSLDAERVYWAHQRATA